MRPLILAALVLDLLVISLVLGYMILATSEFGALWIGLVAALTLFAAFCLLSLRLLGARRSWVVNTWMALLSTTITYWVVDLTSGFLLIQPLSPLMLPDDIIHHRLAPNVVSRIETRDFSMTFTTNRLGLRGGEISLAKDPDQYRVLMLGDSFTLGKGVEDDETFSALLEERLSQLGSRRVQVINAGVDSYTPLLSYLYLRHRLVELDPDLVVLNLDMSDLVQEIAYRELARRDEHGEILAVPASPRDDGLRIGNRVRKWSRNHLFLGRWVIYQLDQWGGAEDETTVEEVVELADLRLLAHTLEGDEVERSGQWASLFESVEKIKAFCNTRGIHFLLTIYPWGHQVDEQQWVPGRNRFLPPGAALSDRSVRIIEQLAAAAGIELLNAFPEFRARRSEGPIYFDYDMHWRPVGHRIMADTLERRLRDRVLESVDSR